MTRAAAVGLCALLALRLAAAGDEVDYDAPYLVVENGELVTRYPAKPHAPPAAGEVTDAGSAALAWLALGLGLAAGLALAVRRRRSAAARGPAPPQEPNRGGQR